MKSFKNYVSLNNILANKQGIDRSKMNSNIKVLKTGDGWIGIEKPCGISVHNDPGNDVLSIVTSMVWEKNIDLQGIMAGENIQIQPVHRLLCIHWLQRVCPGHTGRRSRRH